MSDDHAAVAVDQLEAALSLPLPPLILDVRREPAFAAADGALPGALRRLPDRVEEWAGDLEIARPIIVYCVHGHEVSQGVAARLRSRGREGRHLAGGFEGWLAAGRAAAAKPGAPTLWVTRERPKIDRIACPWLIRRFIDPDARLLYVRADQVLRVAAETGAVPYDIVGVELSHVGAHCSFDTFIARWRLDDPALARLAPIVRGADTDRHELAPEAAGLFAVSLGLSALFAEEDQAMLRHGLVLYDALYRWARDLQDERHSRTPSAPPPALENAA